MENERRRMEKQASLEMKLALCKMEQMKNAIKEYVNASDRYLVEMNIDFALEQVRQAEKYLVAAALTNRKIIDLIECE